MFIKAKIIKNIEMGNPTNSDILHFVNKLYLTIEDDIVFIKAGNIVTIRKVQNGSLEILFSNGDACDVMLDDNKQYKNHLKII